MLARFRTRRKHIEVAAPPSPSATVSDAIEIPGSDPLHAMLLEVAGPIEITSLGLESAAVKSLRSQGVLLVVPLIAQGELLGTLNLGPRLSDQPYSTDDRKLLANLAAQVAPAVKVAQLVRQQQEQAKQSERIEQELRVAALIQHTLLPKDLPSIPGWKVDAYYKPAREVGGDFYDFVEYPDGRIGVVIGDVTDKGVPAALVMATTRSTLRAAASHHEDPGLVLAEANEVLVAEIPPGMFVTCLFGLLDPRTGSLRFANAGHNLPYVRTASGVTELRATGMPLGLMPGIEYEVYEALLNEGDAMLLTSDGIVEQHNSEGEMFGFPRVMGVVGGKTGGDLMGSVLNELSRWTGEGEQEDDVTMVLVRRGPSARDSASSFSALDGAVDLRRLTVFSLSSVEGNEREAMRLVTEAVDILPLADDRLERLKTAVAEATMNAIEHGNHSDPAKLVDVAVLSGNDRVVVRITDSGGGPATAVAETPDIEAKLAGEQTPRGWGLFLIQNMVDGLSTSVEGRFHTIEMVMHLKGASDE